MRRLLDRLNVEYAWWDEMQREGTGDKGELLRLARCARLRLLLSASAVVFSAGGRGEGGGRFGVARVPESRAWCSRSPRAFCTSLYRERYWGWPQTRAKPGRLPRFFNYLARLLQRDLIEVALAST